jgi:C-terminal peptidase prc
MIHRTFALVLALTTAFAAAPTLHAGAVAAHPFPQRDRSGDRSGDLSGLVAGEVAAAASKDIPELWRRAVELREAAKLGEEGELDRELDGWVAKRSDLPPRTVLFVTATRLLGSAPEVLRLADALTPLVDDVDADVAAAAARLLADPAFKAIAPTKRDQLANKMLARAEDAALSPDERLDFAKAAYRTGGGRERIKANKVLRSFLDSQDPELKAEGALAMAELDAVALDGELRILMERIARVPDARGRLAASYLQREDLRRQKDRLRADTLERAQDSALPPEMTEFLAVLRLIQERHLEGKNIEQERLFDAAINGMLQYMDPHSNLLTSEQFAKFYGELSAKYGGIGAYVNQDPDDGLFTIVRPIYSGPAYRSGLMTDDKIVRIGDWPTQGQDVDEIIKHLKGEPETSVDLYIWRHGDDPSLIERPTDAMKVTVVREYVSIPPGTWQMLPGNIGLIQLDDFSQVAMEETRAWIEELKKLGMEALLLDLRFNGGGLLEGAQEVAELFLPANQDVVTTVGVDDGGQVRSETLKTERRNQPVVPADMPLVVLVGGATASAAEIVSGALQDHDRAELVGKTTYGKGSVQSLIQILPNLEDKWEDENGNRIRDPWEKLIVDHDGYGETDYAPRVKLTIAKYLLPSKRSIHREIDRDGRILSEGGVEPDVVVDPPMIEGWRLKEQRRIRPDVRKHVEQTFAENRELYGRLAVNDMKRTELYPGFDGLMASLVTTLKPDDVRVVLRSEIRRRVQDDRGGAFPYGDFVEDVQVQKAIAVALEKLGRSPTDVSEFQPVFDLPEAGSQKELQLARGDPELRRALTLLEEARSGGKVLTREEMDKLIEILGTIDLRKN